ncbi:hypothetical protein PAEVO_03530 [Paenibacillus sp. GM2FR]|uniref:hypothetical protein n=1 Tax=Paenibacillus sp. GM2FR TaxID=2059268 RepID=UPI000C27FE8D|nr:hypothetical protein [Paenibacillus sp. GM2FR]PJN53633.1 hypothetical protein PAEVO_03530 [Paenibacillus sp. GM2FR]
MPVQITINGDNAAQAIEEFATLSAAFGGAAAPSATVSEEPRQRPRKTNEVKKEQPKEEPVKTAPKDEVETDGDTEEVDIPTVVELRAKAQEVGKDAKKKPAIKELLGKFESASISDVPEEKRIAFMAELEAL